MIIFVHNRYRTIGGEERAVHDLIGVVEQRLGERTMLISRDSKALSRMRAASALLRGGERPEEVAAAVRLTGARIVHAHNLHPTLGWRALEAAKAAGAKVVLHLHQYRLVCAVGVCFTAGQRCTRCHGRNTLPGVLHNCRGSRAEALSYAAGLSLWQRRIADLADAIVVPSAFARERLVQLGAPLHFNRVHVLAPPIVALSQPLEIGAADGGYALVVSRLAAEKGVEVAIDACRLASRPLMIAGDGPQRMALRRHAVGADVRFLGEVSAEELAKLRRDAALALVPSRSDETFGIAAGEAMAAGLPVLASRVGALPELLDGQALVEPGDSAAMASGIERLWGDRSAGERNRARVAELCAPQAVASRLAAIYDGVCGA